MTAIDSRSNEYASWGDCWLVRRLVFVSLALSVSAAIDVCSDSKRLMAQVVEGSRTQWLAGKRLEREGNSPVSLSWAQSPIRSQLRQFSTTQKRAIFLDRRVDPNLQLTFRFQNRTTEQIVWSVAKEHDLGVARIGDLLYVGPKEAAAGVSWKIRKLKKRTSSFDAATRKMWSARNEIRWPEATTTDEIAIWFQAQGIKFTGRVPFDVWSAADWPKLSLLEQLSLFAVGFDLDVRIEDDGKSVRFVPALPLGKQTLKVRLNERDPVDVFGIAERIGGLNVRKSRRALTLSGDVVSLANFQRDVLLARNVVSDDSAEKTFSFKSIASRRDMFKAIANQLEKSLEFENVDDAILEQRVSLDLTDVGVEQLLDACVQGSELEYQIDASTLRIRSR